MQIAVSLSECTSVFGFFLVGRDGPPASPLRWGQAGGGRVGVSLTRLCSGDPLQRSKIIRNTHFSCSSSHSLQSLFSSHSTVCFPPSSVFFKAHPETTLLNSVARQLLHCLNYTCCYQINLIPRAVCIQLQWEMRRNKLELAVPHSARGAGAVNSPLTSGMFAVERSLWHAC